MNKNFPAVFPLVIHPRKREDLSHIVKLDTITKMINKQINKNKSINKQIDK